MKTRKQFPAGPAAQAAPLVQAIALSLATLALPSAALADGGETETSVSAGVTTTSGDAADRAQYGQYNGLRTGGKAKAQIGFDYYTRDDEAGTMLHASGNHLLEDSRSLDLRWKRQGSWKFGASFDQGVRADPWTVNTGLVGSGSGLPQVNVVAAGAGTDQVLQLKRSQLGLSLWTAVMPGLDFQARMSTEHKEGSRLFGIGMNCPSGVAITCGSGNGSTTDVAVLLLPEPVDWMHHQFDSRLSYATERASYSAGYYASFFRNATHVMVPGIPSALNNPVGTSQPLGPGLQALLGSPVALAPDNQAQQFDLSANALLGKTLQLRARLAYGEALQHQDFAGAGLSAGPAGVTNLGGKVATTSALLGLSMRPMPQLGLHADLRYEDREDQTPLRNYVVDGTAVSTNRQLSNTRTRSKMQALYQFSPVYRGSLVVNVNAIDRGAYTPTSSPSGIGAMRQRTTDTGATAEVRRSLSETVGATLGVTRSRRSGSTWLRDNSGPGVTAVPDPNAPGSGLGATAIYMPTMADRERKAFKLRTDWQPSDELSVQVAGLWGRDRYDTPSNYGLRNNGNSSLALDAAYALSERWSLTGYASHGRQTLLQARPGSYVMAYTNKSDGFGLGATGKVMKVDVGGSIGRSSDTSRYDQTLDAAASTDSVLLLAATGGLPDIVYRQTQLRLFAKLDIDKQSSARIDLVHVKSHVADWTWGYGSVPYTYSDGSTVWQKPDQSVTGIGLSYTQRWR